MIWIILGAVGAAVADGLRTLWVLARPTGPRLRQLEERTEALARNTGLVFNPDGSLWPGYWEWLWLNNRHLVRRYPQGGGGFSPYLTPGQFYSSACAEAENSAKPTPTGGITMVQAGEAIVNLFYAPPLPEDLAHLEQQLIGSPSRVDQLAISLIRQLALGQVDETSVRTALAKVDPWSAMCRHGNLRGRCVVCNLKKPQKRLPHYLESTYD